MPIVTSDWIGVDELLNANCVTIAPIVERPVWALGHIRGHLSARKMLGLSQRHMGRAITKAGGRERNISPSTVCKREKGRWISARYDRDVIKLVKDRFLALKPGLEVEVKVEDHGNRLYFRALRTCETCPRKFTVKRDGDDHNLCSHCRRRSNHSRPAQQPGNGYR